jgi:phosphohistidine phosphatase
MKRVVLLRHAEAIPAQAEQRDFDRPLNERGRAAARAVARRLATSQLPIGVLYVSPAARTRETAQIIAARIDAADRIQLESALYPGTPESLWATLQQTDERVHCALLIGHNPAVSTLAAQCSPGSAERELPTAGWCLVGFPPGIPWNALRREQARRLELAD